MLLVARWLRTVWFGSTSTLASSFIGVAPLSTLLDKNMGSEGGTGCVSITALARAYRELPSGASRRTRYSGISLVNFVVSAAFLVVAAAGRGELGT